MVQTLAESENFFLLKFHSTTEENLHLQVQKQHAVLFIENNYSFLSSIRKSITDALGFELTNSMEEQCADVSSEESKNEQNSKLIVKW